VDSLMRNMTPHNAGEYVDLPDNARVADVRLLARKMPALVDSMV
jgi:hypothetical protein